MGYAGHEGGDEMSEKGREMAIIGDSLDTLSPYVPCQDIHPIRPLETIVLVYEPPPVFHPLQLDRIFHMPEKYETRAPDPFCAKCHGKGSIPFLSKVSKRLKHKPCECVERQTRRAMR